MKMKRRGNDEGSIAERSDGRWQYSQRVGRDENGKPLRVTIYAATRPELLRKIADAKARAGGSLQPPVDHDVASFVTSYLAGVDPSKVERAARTDDRADISASYYEGLERANRHLAPHLKMRMDRFRPADVPKIRTALRKKYGTRTIQVAWQLMRLVFDEAIRQGKYISANPWKLYAAPSYEPKKRRALQAAEIPRFIQAAKGDRFEGVFLLGLMHRVRLGEALGLEWSSVNFKTGEISIRQQLDKEQRQARVKEPGSERTIYAGGELLDALKRRRAEANAEGHGSSFVFTNPEGGHPSRSKYIGAHFKTICTSAKIVDFTIHGLCHTWSVEAIDSGTPVTVAAQLGGWKGTRMLTERYAMHRREEQQRAASLEIQKRITRRRK